MPDPGLVPPGPVSIGPGRTCDAAWRGGERPWSKPSSRAAKCLQASGSVVLAPRAHDLPGPARLLVGSVRIEAVGLLPVAWLTPRSHYLPLILAATIIEGLSTGVAGPAALNTALRAVLPADTGAAGAVTSAASRIGSSIGAALARPSPTCSPQSAAPRAPRRPGRRCGPRSGTRRRPLPRRRSRRCRRRRGRSPAGP